MNCLATRLHFAMSCAALLLLPFSVAIAQDEDDRALEVSPHRDASQMLIVGEDERRPYDRGANVGGRANAPAGSATRRGASRVKSHGVTVRGRIRTTLLGDRNHDVKIVEDPSRGIMMEITRHYSSKQLAMLKGKYPELSDYVDLFPTKIGDEDIELTISFKQKYKAREPAELKQQSLDAFQTYRRHIQTNGDHLAKLRNQNP